MADTRKALLSEQFAALPGRLAAANNPMPIINAIGSAAYKVAVPVNARMLLDTMAGNTAPITEKDFSSTELQSLVDAVRNAKTSNAANEQGYRARAAKSEAAYMQHPEHDLTETSPGVFSPAPKTYAKFLQESQAAAASYDKNRAKTSVGYNDYPDRLAAPTFDGPLSAAWRSYTDPEYRMKTTLGSFNAFDSPEALHIKDKYNFDAAQFYSMIHGVDVNKAGVMDMLKAANGPVEFFDMYMQRYHPSASRDVNITIPNQPKK